MPRTALLVRVGRHVAPTANEMLDQSKPRRRPEEAVGDVMGRRQRLGSA